MRNSRFGNVREPGATRLMLENKEVRLKGEQEAAIRLAEEAAARRDWSEATERWRAAVALAPSATQARVFEHLAIALRMSGDAQAASEAAREGLAWHPDDVRIAIQFAEAAMASQEWQTACVRWQALLARHPDRAPTVAYERYTAALRRSGVVALVKADTVASRGLARDPSHVGLAIQHAEVAMARQDWNDALRRWQTVVERCGADVPDDVQTRIDAALLKCGRQGFGTLRARLAAAWSKAHDTLDEEGERQLARLIESWPSAPVLSVIMPCCDPSVDNLSKAIDSVRSQIYPHWELCIADDASLDARVHEHLRAVAASDPRIKVVFRQERGHIARASNSALTLASGAFCYFLDHDDQLTRHALAFIAGEIVRDPRLDWIYSDIDRIDENGQRQAPLYRVSPDPDLCLATAHMGAHAVIRTDLLRKLGGLREGTDGAQDHDLALRLLHCTPMDRIRHIPNVLYHWQGHEGSTAGQFLQKPYAVQNRERVVRDHLAREGIAADVRHLQASSGVRVKYRVDGQWPLVSILIPTRDSLEILRRCIESLRERTNYPAIEIILVDNGSNDPAALRYLDYLEASEIARVLRAPGPFNWAHLNNLAARGARGEILCLLNNDIEAVSEGWLRELVSHVMRPGVGIAGAALWYADGRLQHGGVYFAPSTGEALHAFKGQTRGELPSLGRVVRTVSAVTGACLVVKRQTYLEAGGMDEDWLPIGYNDVDFCLRVRERLGLRCVWTPFADLVHLESASRAVLDPEAASAQASEARRIVAARWHEELVADPYFSPAFVGWSGRTENARPGPRQRLRRYHYPRPRGLAFMHIPKTAGVTLRDRLVQDLPRPAVLAISARTMLGCYEGDEAALRAVKHRLEEADILFSHFSYGFGALVGWDCCYATILRDPSARTLSHYRHLIHRPSSRFSRSPLAKAPLSLLLRKGVVAGNLMVRKLLGEPPERTPWHQIAASCAPCAGFAGFSLPDSMWRGDYAEVLDGPDLAPGSELALVDRAMEIIADNFAFVGRLEQLETQLELRLRCLGLHGAPSLSRLNIADSSAVPELSAGDREALQEYNQLDRALCDRIGRLRDGMHLDPSMLANWSLGG